MTPLTAIIIFGVLGLGALYVLWPVLRPRIVGRLGARKARRAATDARLDRNWNMSRDNMLGVAKADAKAGEAVVVVLASDSPTEGEWRVIQLDPPRDGAQWPKWNPTPKGRWES